MRRKLLGSVICVVVLATSLTGCSSVSWRTKDITVDNAKITPVVNDKGEYEAQSPYYYNVDKVVRDLTREKDLKKEYEIVKETYTTMSIVCGNAQIDSKMEAASAYKKSEGNIISKLFNRGNLPTFYIAYEQDLSGDDNNVSVTAKFDAKKYKEQRDIENILEVALGEDMAEFIVYAEDSDGKARALGTEIDKDNLADEMVIGSTNYIFNRDVAVDDESIITLATEMSDSLNYSKVGSSDKGSDGLTKTLGKFQSLRPDRIQDFLEDYTGIEKDMRSVTNAEWSDTNRSESFELSYGIDGKKFDISYTLDKLNGDLVDLEITDKTKTNMKTAKHKLSVLFPGTDFSNIKVGENNMEVKMSNGTVKNAKITVQKNDLGVVIKESKDK